MKKLASVSTDTDVLYIGSRTGLEASLISDADYPFVGLDVAGLPRKVSLSSLAALAKMSRAVFKARSILKGFKPDVVVGTGAYVSLPVVLAAWTRRIPTVIHEQNSVPGLANRILGRVATAIAVTYPATKEFFPKNSLVELTGNPVREDILAADRSKAREGYGIGPTDRTILVFGGSRGARKLNDALIGALERLLDAGLTVLHSAGESDYPRVRKAIGEGGGERYRLFPYLDMAPAYAAADLVVCRAGATTVAEVTARGLPSVLVPYPYATGDHQARNAQALAEAGAARLIADGALDRRTLADAVLEIIGDPTVLKRMAEAALGLGKPEAADKLAKLVLDVSGSSDGRRGSQTNGKRALKKQAFKVQ